MNSLSSSFNKRMFLEIFMSRKLVVDSYGSYKIYDSNFIIFYEDFKNFLLILKMPDIWILLSVTNSTNTTDATSAGNISVPDGGDVISGLSATATPGPMAAMKDQGKVRGEWPITVYIGRHNLDQDGETEKCPELWVK